MVPLLIVALAILVLFGIGFIAKVLWWIAVLVLIVWVLGFFVRPGGTGGTRGRWYRW
ncbi:hydrophobic protein [Streptomyces avicenniae]|uniref:hydrophobic protein n=1 Tax=Streptomyces avicenniae TaxID=500153 RepID=UPI00069C039F|nr:hydrophobic protein [Streptomyces avicenniae]